MSEKPNPLGGLHLFGFADRRLDLILTVVLIVVVVASRMIAFPATIWEQDEAVFAAAVLDFDATANRPHPPWFPLWIGMGKLVHLAGVGPAKALQLISFAFSVWIIFPLTALWSTVMPRYLAVASAMLFLVSPGVWLFSGRAFSGTTATALLVAALAFWLQAENRVGWLVAGSVCGGLAVLVRPHFLPAVVMALIIIARRVPGSHRRWLVAALVVPVGLGCVALAGCAGGAAPLWSALETHAQYHFSRLGAASHGLSESGLSRSLGHPFVAVIWLVLFHIGLVRAIRRKRWRAISPIVLGSLAPIVFVIHGLSNPTHARYTIPVLALTSGLVILGVTAIFRRWAWPVTATAIVVAAGFVTPALGVYRTATSPPLAAIESAMLEANSNHGVLVADRSLHSFFVLRRLQRPTNTPILFDHMIELGHASPPPPDRTVYLFDAGNGGLLERAERERSVRCETPLLRNLSQDRFIDLVVASGATLRGHPDVRGPLILID